MSSTGLDSHFLLRLTCVIVSFTVPLRDSSLHLTVTQFKVQAEQQRLEAMTGQVAQAERGLENAKAATEKQKKKLEALQKENKAAKAIALTVQDIEAMGKKATFGNNITLTPDGNRLFCGSQFFFQTLVSALAIMPLTA